jgi:glucose-6-phosphate 1-dehydrogenase
MTPLHSDALVFFGATGDLAYKKIFPALQAMVKRGHLNVPVIGVSKAGWKLDQLKARARDSVEKHGGLDAPAFEKLSGLLRYVDGDYKDTETFQAIRKELGSAQRPAHYLAIPPVLFGLVVEQLAKSGCTNGARVIIEKPFGLNVIAPGEDTVSQADELIVSRHPRAEEMDAYERVLGDAMEGDPTLFAREDYVEEAWRIVDPILEGGDPRH